MGATVPLEELTDGELVLAAREAPPGDHRAFTELLKRHQGRVHTNCRYLVSLEEADDLAQDVLVKAYFGLAKFQARSSFQTWLDKIKTNHCLNHLQKLRRTRERSVPIEVAEEVRDPTEPELLPDRIAEEQAVHEALLGLSPNLRIPLVLSDMDDFTLAEIAEMLNIGLSAAKMRVARGRQAFRELYGSEDSGALSEG